MKFARPAFSLLHSSVESHQFRAEESELALAQDVPCQTPIFSNFESLPGKSRSCVVILLSLPLVVGAPYFAFGQMTQQQQEQQQRKAQPREEQQRKEQAREQQRQEKQRENQRRE
jgi:uncharacterized protein HemX